MTLPPITFVTESPTTDPMPGYAGPRIFLPFIEELEQRAAMPIPVRYGLLKEALPLEGFILLDSPNHPVMTLDEQAPELRAKLAEWIVPIGIHDVGHKVYSKVLEPLSLPAAIDGASFQDWRSSSKHGIGARGLYGLHAIAHLIGAECEDAFSLSERYCYLTSRVHFGLPHLLLDYLTALANTRAT